MVGGAEVVGGAEGGCDIVSGVEDMVSRPGVRRLEFVGRVR